MRVGRMNINPIDAILAVLLPVTAIGLYVEFSPSPSPEKILRAAGRGDYEWVFKHLDEEFDPSTRDVMGRTLLQIAIEQSEWDSAERILSLGGMVSERDKQGYTPFHRVILASDKASHKLFRAMLGRIGNPNFTSQKGEPLLAFALRQRNRDAAAAIIDAGADFTFTTVDGYPCVPFVIEKRMHGVLERMLVAGFSPNEADIGLSNPLLSLAIEHRDPVTTRLLLEYGADVDARFKCEWVWRTDNPSARPGIPSKQPVSWKSASGKILPPYREHWGIRLIPPGRKSRRDSAADHEPGVRRYYSIPRKDAEPLHVLPLDFALIYDRYPFRDSRSTASVLAEYGAPAELIPRLMTLAMQQL